MKTALEPKRNLGQGRRGKNHAVPPLASFSGDATDLQQPSSRIRHLCCNESKDMSMLLLLLDVGSSVGDIVPEIVVPPVDTVVVSASDDDVARLECVVNAR